MELEQRDIIKFLHLKGLNFRKSHSNFPVHTAKIRTRGGEWNIVLIKSSSGESISKRNMLMDDHLSTMLMLKFYQFSENFSFLQCERLLTP
jgi:hypothetical protein